VATVTAAAAFALGLRGRLGFACRCGLLLLTLLATLVTGAQDASAAAKDCTFTGAPWQMDGRTGTTYRLTVLKGVSCADAVAVVAPLTSRSASGAGFATDNGWVCQSFAPQLPLLAVGGCVKLEMSISWEPQVAPASATGGSTVPAEPAEPPQETNASAATDTGAGQAEPPAESTESAASATGGTPASAAASGGGLTTPVLVALLLAVVAATVVFVVARNPAVLGSLAGLATTVREKAARPTSVAGRRRVGGAVASARAWTGAFVARLGTASDAKRRRRSTRPRRSEVWDHDAGVGETPVSPRTPRRAHLAVAREPATAPAPPQVQLASSPQGNAIVAAAEHTARAIVAAAQAEADRVLARAGADAAAIVQQARHDAADIADETDALVGTARADANRMLSEAGSDADEFVREAQQSAARVTSEAAAEARALIAAAEAEAEQVRGAAHADAEIRIREAQQQARRITDEAEREARSVLAAAQGEAERARAAARASRRSAERAAPAARPPVEAAPRQREATPLDQELLHLTQRASANGDVVSDGGHARTGDASGSNDEARYLDAVMAAPALRRWLALYQPELFKLVDARGLRPRDIEKAGWHLPIPAFDPANESHTKLVRLARRAEAVAAKAELSGGNGHDAEERVREALEANGVSREIDSIVIGLLLH
jgi:cell division septum initiation protein DivIVA